MALQAAPEDQALLLELQEFDTRLQRIAQLVHKLPETAQLEQLLGEEETLRRALSEHNGVWEDAVAELKRVESDVAVVEARIARDSERLQTTSSVKDVQAFEQELASLALRREELEEIQLAVMERVEQLEAELAEQRNNAAELAERIASTRDARSAALAELDRERMHLTANRETVAGRVPTELLALYEKQRERYGIGASHLRAGVSSASGVALTATDLKAVRAASPSDVLLCPDSSAVLVRTAESGL